MKSCLKHAFVSPSHHIWFLFLFSPGGCFSRVRCRSGSRGTNLPTRELWSTQSHYARRASHLDQHFTRSGFHFKLISHFTPDNSGETLTFAFLLSFIFFMIAGLKIERKAAVLDPFQTTWFCSSLSRCFTVSVRSGARDHTVKPDLSRSVEI